MATLTFHGGARSVTGANYLVETDLSSESSAKEGSSKILVDCGLSQGTRHAEAKNFSPFPYNPSEIDAVFITHSHIDHVGLLPKLVKRGFRGKIFMTAPTRDFAKIMLDDSQSILEEEAKERGAELLYSKEDIARAMELVEAIHYGDRVNAAQNIEARFRDAGHILGSAIVELWLKEGAKETKIVFSGDLGNPPVPLLKRTEFIKEADYVVVESTYGDRAHETMPERKSLLEDAIEDVIAMGGTLMIPSFAIERTQELLFEMNSLVENHRIPKIPIFIDSPLAIKATKIYSKYPDYYNKKAVHLMRSGDELFNFPRLKFTYKTEQSKAINDVAPPKIVIAGSGMSTGGRILHHERRYLSDPNSMLLIIGYQVAGSLGRRVLDGAKSVKIFRESVPVRCSVRAIGGYSAHADREALYHWIEHIKRGGKLKKVFAVQGEDAPALSFVQLLRDRLGIYAEAPLLRDKVELK